MIPLVDLASQYHKIRTEVLTRIEELLDSRSFIQGEYVAEFESKFSKLHRSYFASGCSNGTSALYLALKALGVGPGDEVITTPHTFIATAEAIANVGAKPVFADINPLTLNIEPTEIVKHITKKTKAIIPVHIYGNPCDMSAIMQIAEDHNLFLIEDCAQAHFAKYKGQFVGTFGDASTFSFYPGKNLGAYGDAGLVLVKNKEIETTVRKLLDHGRLSKYEHDLVGDNFRMDGIQAVVLLVKLNYIFEWTETRKKNALLYDSFIHQSGVSSITILPGAECVYHLYVVQVSNRKDIIDYLKSKGITTSIHYPIPLHLQPAFKFLGYNRGNFPIAESAANRIMSLPMCGELRPEQIEFIATEFNKVVIP